VDGVHLIYRVSHGNSPPDPGRLPGFDPGHPGQGTDPPSRGRTTPGRHATPRDAPQDLPGCTADISRWARPIDRLADKE